MFWGIVLEPDVRYVIKDDEAFKITRAALEFRSADDFACVKIVSGPKEFVLCYLDAKSDRQLPLDVVLDGGEDVSVVFAGSGTVHLTGYYIPEGGFDPEDSSVEGESCPCHPAGEELELPLPRRKKRKLGDVDQDSDDGGKANKKRFGNFAEILESTCGNYNSDEDSPFDPEDDDEDELDEEDVDDEDGGLFAHDVECMNLLSSSSTEESDEDEEEKEEDESDSEEALEEEVPTKQVMKTKKIGKKVLNVVEEVVGVQESEEKKKKKKKKIRQEKEEAEEEVEPEILETPAENGVSDCVDERKKKKKKKNKNKGDEDEAVNGADYDDDSVLPNGTTTAAINFQTPAGKVIQSKKGVTMTTLVAGGGPTAVPGKKVVIYYTGRVKATGEEFDSVTKGKGKAFRLGSDDVIKGWNLGIGGMAVGEKRRLEIPPKYGYGKEGLPPKIPPKATLIFDIELKAVG